MSKRETCSVCTRPQTQCYCDSISVYENSLPTLLIRHIRESSHPFNTGRMAALTYKNFKLIESNDPNLHKVINDFINEYNPFLLFKTQSSLPISKEEINNHGAMIVLDGTWDKAKAILFANKELQKLTQLHLQESKKSIYKSIRKACSEDFLSTFEAITSVYEMQESRSLEEQIKPLKTIVEQQRKWSP